MDIDVVDVMENLQGNTGAGFLFTTVRRTFPLYPKKLTLPFTRVLYNSRRVCAPGESCRIAECVWGVVPSHLNLLAL